MSLDSVFSSIGNSAEFIKNQSLYADYYQDFGWFGTLQSLDNLNKALGLIDEKSESLKVSGIYQNNIK